MASVLWRPAGPGWEEAAESGTMEGSDELPQGWTVDEKLVRDRDEVVERIRRELRILVRESGWTQRRVEETNGFTQGYLSQVLQGHIALTARHLFGILLAIGMAPEDFFDRVLHRTSTDELRERMARYEAALEQLELQGLIKTRQAESADE